MKPWRIHVGDALEQLREMPDESVQCCVTSPPYWGLRDYGVTGQLGLEATPELYVDRLVEVFRDVRRVLAKDGTLWLNLGDCYATGAGKVGATYRRDRAPAAPEDRRRLAAGLKIKDRVMIPARVALALQADGWWLRDEIVWHKPNTTPASISDRTTPTHEMVYLLTRSRRYFYDDDAIAEPAVTDRNGNRARKFARQGQEGRLNTHQGYAFPWRNESGKRNRRSVWRIPTTPFPAAHFAVMPKALVEPCVLAGSRPGDTVLDPFAGAGTVGVVALRLGRSFVGIELNPEYVALASRRIEDDAPLLNRPGAPLSEAPA